MKRRCCAFLAAAVALASTLVHGAATDAEVTARKRALGVAGAFTNAGFKLRDGHWTGAIGAGKPQVIQVNLYAGNEYWFSLASASPKSKLAVTVYDEMGAPVDAEPFVDEGAAAAGFAPEVSGPYYVKVEYAEGDPATFCLLYSYK